MWIPKFDKRLKTTEKEIYLVAGKEFNIGSPKQLGEIIYNDLKIAKLKRLKKGVWQPTLMFWKT